MTAARDYFGVGLRIGAATAVYFTLALTADRLLHPYSALPGPPLPPRVLGAAMLVVGGLAYVRISRRLRAAVAAEKLLTTGVFARLRHPLYALGIYLLAPGFCLQFGAWLVLTTPIAMALIYRRLIRTEERALEARFGPAYRTYRQHTGGIWPTSLCVRR